MGRIATGKFACTVLGVFFLALAPSLKAQEHAVPKGEPAASHSDTAAGDTAASHGATADSHGAADPSHGFASPMLNNPMEWRADSALFSLVVFLMLLAVLWAFAWKPITHGLEKRERLIATQIAEAKKASADAAATLKDYQAQLAAAHSQAQEMLAQARKDAETSGQRILAEARTEAAQQRDRALAEINSAKRVALNELASHSTDIAVSLAQRIVGRELNAMDHQNLVQEMLANLPSRN